MDHLMSKTQYEETLLNNTITYKTSASNPRKSIGNDINTLLSVSTSQRVVISLYTNSRNNEGIHYMNIDKDTLPPNRHPTSYIANIIETILI